MEQISIVLQVGLADVVLENLFFFGVLLEVLFERAIAHQLFFEFEDFLLLNRLVGEMVEDGLDARLGLAEFGPDDGQALEHVVLAEALPELALQVSQHANVLLIVRHGETEHAARLVRNGQARLLVSVEVSGHVEVHNVSDILHDRPLCIASVKHYQKVELPNVEEMQDRADLCLRHVC